MREQNSDQGVRADAKHRLHWHCPDEQPPERVTFWRGGIRSDRPRWEQEYVRADHFAGAIDALRELVDHPRSDKARMKALTVLGGGDPVKELARRLRGEQPNARAGTDEERNHGS